MLQNFLYVLLSSAMHLKARFIIYPKFLDVLLQERFTHILSNISRNESFRVSMWLKKSLLINIILSSRGCQDKQDFKKLTIQLCRQISTQWTVLNEIITKWRFKEGVARQMEERCFYLIGFTLLHTFYRSVICVSKSIGILSIRCDFRQGLFCFVFLLLHISLRCLDSVHNKLGTSASAKKKLYFRLFFPRSTITYK